MTPPKVTSRGVFVLPGLHLCLCIAVSLDLLPPSEWSNWFIVYLIDFPVSIIPLLLHPIPPLVGFGIVGTAWWYFLGRLYLLESAKLANEREKPPAQQ
jgi:hypothetical protein